MAHMESRNNKIYNDHMDGKSNKEIAKKYCLKEPTIKKIINKIKDQDRQINEFYQTLDKYLEDKYSKYSFIIENCLMIYLHNNSIYKKQDIYDLIMSDTKIHGIGKVYRSILRQFVKSQNDYKKMG